MFIEIKVLEKVHPKARGSRPRVIVLKCDECNEIFEKKYGVGYTRQDEHFCSQDCGRKNSGKKNRKPRFERHCSECGETKLVIARLLLHNNIFCNSQCYHAWRLRQDFLIENCIKNMHTENSRRQARMTLLEGRASGRTVHPWTDRHHTQETKDKISIHHTTTGCLKGNKNGMFKKKHTKKSREKMSETKSLRITQGVTKPHKNRSRSGTYFSTKNQRDYYYRSSWELEFFKYLDKNVDVVTFQYESVRIPYYRDGHKRWYTPDFLVTYSSGIKRMYEIKPQWQVNSEEVKLKAEAAREYCKREGVDAYMFLKLSEIQALGLPVK